MNQLIDDQDPAKVTGVQGEEHDLAETEDDLGIGGEVEGDEPPAADPEGEGEDGADGEEGEEGDPEGEPDPEATADADAPAAAGKGKPPASIPYSRFHEVNERRKASDAAAQAAAERAEQLERENAELKIRAARPDNEDQLIAALDAAETELESARYEDDPDVVKAARAKVREATLAVADARAEARSEARRQHEDQQRAIKAADDAYNATYAELVATYPQIKTPDMTKALIAMRDNFYAQGMAAHEALREAVTTQVRLLGLQPASAAAPGKTRMQRSIEKHIDAAERIPPRNGPAGTGARQRGSAPDMSREDWDKLSQDERDQHLGIA